MADQGDGVEDGPDAPVGGRTTLGTVLGAGDVVDHLGAGSAHVCVRADLVRLAAVGVRRLREGAASNVGRLREVVVQVQDCELVVLDPGQGVCAVVLDVTDLVGTVVHGFQAVPVLVAGLGAGIDRGDVVQDLIRRALIVGGCADGIFGTTCTCVGGRGSWALCDGSYQL